MMKTNNLLKMWDLIQENGGASWQIDRGLLNPETGYMVALAGYESKLDIPINVNKWQDAVINYLVKAGKARILADNPDYYLGAWIEDNQLYLDISEHIPDLETAKELGFERKQKAIFDCENKTSIYL